MRTYPAADRNKDAIAQVLKLWLASSTRVLEIASGTGQHIAYFAEQLAPNIIWQPSEYTEDLLTDILARTHLYSNVLRPIQLDVESQSWPIGKFDVVYTANLLHISPSSCSSALFAGAAHTLKQDGQLIIYGPFMEHGKHNSEGNQTFDSQLKQQSDQWGIRDIDWLAELAHLNAFKFTEQIAMPANNRLLRFTKK